VIVRFSRFRRLHYTCYHPITAPVRKKRPEKNFVVSARLTGRFYLADLFEMAVGRRFARVSSNQVLDARRTTDNNWPAGYAGCDTPVPVLQYVLE